MRPLYWSALAYGRYLLIIRFRYTVNEARFGPYSVFCIVAFCECPGVAALSRDR